MGKEVGLAFLDPANRSSRYLTALLFHKGNDDDQIRISFL